MSGQFKVGEVLEGCKFVVDIYRNGMECAVVGKLKTRHWFDRYTGDIGSGKTYLVKWADGIEKPAWPHTLRRKQPPTGEQSVMDLFKAPQPKRMVEPA